MYADWHDFTYRAVEKGYDPELPVGECSVADVLLEHLSHPVSALPGNRDARRRQLGLTRAGKWGSNKIQSTLFNPIS